MNVKKKLLNTWGVKKPNQRGRRSSVGKWAVGNSSPRSLLKTMYVVAALTAFQPA